MRSSPPDRGASKPTEVEMDMVEAYINYHIRVADHRLKEEFAL